MEPNTTVIAICTIAIVASIIIGWKFDLNIGVLALGCAFVIGYFGLGMSVNSIIKLWPQSITFYLMMIPFFYSFANINGTMKVLANHLLRLIGGKAWLLPFATFLVSFLVSFLGAGGATNAIVGPVIMPLCLITKQNPAVYAMIIMLGSSIGIDNPFNGETGMMQMATLEKTWGIDLVFPMNMRLWLSTIVRGVITLLLLYFIYKMHKGENIDLKNHAITEEMKFNPQQKKSLVLIGIILFLCIVPKLLNLYFSTPLIKKIAKFCEPQVLVTLGAIIACVTKLGNAREMAKKVPVNTIFTVVGVSILVSVASNAGMVELISHALSGSVPTFLVMPILVILCGFLSFFAGSVTVICPAFFPMVPGIAAATGLNEMALCACILQGATSTGTSPFSSGGSLMIAATPDELRDVTFKSQIINSILIWAFVFLLSFVGFFNIFSMEI